MKYLLIVCCYLSGCALIDPLNPPDHLKGGEPIPPGRLYWPQKVDKAVSPNGTVYHIIKENRNEQHHQ